MHNRLASPWLLAALIVTGCGSGPEIALSPPDFFEDGKPTADPAELRYPSDSFAVAQARFIHGHLQATHPRLKAGFLLPSTCELIDSMRTRVARMEGKISFEAGTRRTEWFVTFGQETPGQWRAGRYRVACKVGTQGTSASFGLVGAPAGALSADSSGPGDQPTVTLREAFQSLRFQAAQPGEGIVYEAAFAPPAGSRIRYHAPECAFARRGGQSIWRPVVSVTPDPSGAGRLTIQGELGHDDRAGSVLPGFWYFVCVDDGERVFRDSLTIAGELPAAGTAYIGAIPGLTDLGGSVGTYDVITLKHEPPGPLQYAHKFSSAYTGVVGGYLHLTMKPAASPLEIPLLCSLYRADGTAAGDFTTSVTVQAGDTTLTADGEFAAPDDLEWGTGKYLMECTTKHEWVGYVVFEVVP